MAFRVHIEYYDGVQTFEVDRNVSLTPLKARRETRREIENEVRYALDYIFGKERDGDAEAPRDTD